MTSLAGVIRLLRLGAVLAVAALLVPGASPGPAAISLLTVDTAEGVDVGDDVVWVLVLGSDARPGEEVSKGDTDAIQLVGINTGSGNSASIGIPRDSWLDMPEIGEDRINAALRDGGRDVVTQVVADVVGITPDYLVVIGFEAFEELLGEVGPVTVTTPESFVSHGVAVHEGPNTFNPDEALAYARHRKTLDDGDFGRSANHQRLMLGALEGFQADEDEEGFTEQAALTALSAVETDLGPLELYRLTQALTSIDAARVTTCVLPATPGVGPGGASVVFLDEPAALAVGDDARDDARIKGSCHPS